MGRLLGVSDKDRHGYDILGNPSAIRLVMLWRWGYREWVTKSAMKNIMFAVLDYVDTWNYVSGVFI